MKINDIIEEVHIKGHVVDLASSGSGYMCRIGCDNPTLDDIIFAETVQSDIDGIDGIEIVNSYDLGNADWNFCGKTSKEVSKKYKGVFYNNMIIRVGRIFFWTYSENAQYFVCLFPEKYYLSGEERFRDWERAIREEIRRCGELSNVSKSAKHDCNVLKDAIIKYVDVYK